MTLSQACHFFWPHIFSKEARLSQPKTLHLLFVICDLFCLFSISNISRHNKLKSQKSYWAGSKTKGLDPSLGSNKHPHIYIWVNWCWEEEIKIIYLNRTALKCVSFLNQTHVPFPTNQGLLIRNTLFYENKVRVKIVEFVRFF